MLKVDRYSCETEHNLYSYNLSVTCRDAKSKFLFDPDFRIQLHTLIEIDFRIYSTSISFLLETDCDSYFCTYLNSTRQLKKNSYQLRPLISTPTSESI